MRIRDRFSCGTEGGLNLLSLLLWLFFYFGIATHWSSGPADSWQAKLEEFLGFFFFFFSREASKQASSERAFFFLQWVMDMVYSS